MIRQLAPCERSDPWARPVGPCRECGAPPPPDEPTVIWTAGADVAHLCRPCARDVARRLGECAARMDAYRARFLATFGDASSESHA